MLPLPAAALPAGPFESPPPRAARPPTAAALPTARPAAGPASGCGGAAAGEGEALPLPAAAPLAGLVEAPPPRPGSPLKAALPLSTATLPLEGALLSFPGTNPLASALSPAARAAAPSAALGSTTAAEGAGNRASEGVERPPPLLPHAPLSGPVVLFFAEATPLTAALPPSARPPPRLALGCSGAAEGAVEAPPPPLPLTAPPTGLLEAATSIAGSPMGAEVLFSAPAWVAVEGTLLSFNCPSSLAAAAPPPSLWLAPGGSKAAAVTGVPPLPPVESLAGLLDAACSTTACPLGAALLRDALLSSTGASPLDAALLPFSSPASLSAAELLESAAAPPDVGVAVTVGVMLAAEGAGLGASTTPGALTADELEEGSLAHALPADALPADALPSATPSRSLPALLTSLLDATAAALSLVTTCPPTSSLRTAPRLTLGSKGAAPGEEGVPSLPPSAMLAVPLEAASPST